MTRMPEGKGANSRSGPWAATFVLVASLGLAGCDSLGGLLGGAPRPAARVAGVGLQGLSLEGVDLVFDLEVSNPYELPLPVIGLDYALTSQGEKFLEGSSEEAGTIPAKAKRTIPVSAKVGFAPTLALLRQVKPGGVVPYEAALGVAVDAPAIGKLRLPLATAGEFPVPAIPSVNLREVKWQRLSLQEAAAVVSLELGNANSFPIDLNSMSYALTLAGAKVAESRLTRPVSFAAGKAEVLEIPVSFNPASLGLAGLSLLQGTGGSYAIDGTMETTTRFGALFLPLSGAGATTFKR